MKQGVYKYTYPSGLPGEWRIRLALHSDFLTVGFQGADLVVWALVELDEQRAEGVVLDVAWSGEPLPEGCPPRDGSDHVGSATDRTGLVWHVFRRPVG